MYDSIFSCDTYDPITDVVLTDRLGRTSLDGKKLKQQNTYRVAQKSKLLYYVNSLLFLSHPSDYRCGGVKLVHL